MHLPSISRATIETVAGEFFFGAKLPAESTDFPEQEIAVRWLKRHGDMLTMIQVHRLSNGNDVAANLFAELKNISC